MANYVNQEVYSEEYGVMFYYDENGGCWTPNLITGQTAYECYLAYKESQSQTEEEQPTLESLQEQISQLQSEYDTRMSELQESIATIAISNLDDEVEAE